MKIGFVVFASLISLVFVSLCIGWLGQHPNCTGNFFDYSKDQIFARSKPIYETWEIPKNPDQKLGLKNGSTDFRKLCGLDLYIKHEMEVEQEPLKTQTEAENVPEIEAIVEADYYN